MRIVDIQKIEDLHEDLMVVLESHMDELETGDLYYEIIKFFTSTLYAHAPDHKQAYKILHAAMNDGIKTHISTHEAQ